MAPAADGQPVPFLPGTPKPWFIRGFGKYTLRLVKKRFFAMRLAREHAGTMDDLAAHEGPAIVVLNHCSWWDPLTALVLQRLYMPDRPSAAPMDYDQLKRFGFFKHIGIFGVDPQNRASLDAMGSYVQDLIAQDRRATLWVTPQGEFADIRDASRLRPGTAAIAARTPGVRVLSVAVEYGFWVEQKPEVFLRFQPVDVESETPSTTDWHRALTAGMRENADALAGHVRSRDPDRFRIIHGKGAAQTNPVYDLYLRLTGRAGAIQAKRRDETATP